MKKYFENKIKTQMPSDKSKISKATIEDYRKLLLMELKKMGADENDIDLVSDAVIINAINKDRKAEDVAWAILQ